MVREPAATVAVDGTAKLSEFRDKPTAAPPAGAGADSVTTQVADAPALTVDGLHVMPLTAGD